MMMMMIITVCVHPNIWRTLLSHFFSRNGTQKRSGPLP